MAEDEAAIDLAVASAQNADLVVVTTNNAYAVDATTKLPAPAAAAQTRLVQALLATGKPVVVAAMRNPYDVASFPEAPTVVDTFGYTTHQVESLVRVLFGEVKPAGRLPVSIPRTDGTGDMFPFGHGLSYTTFDVSAPRLDRTSIRRNGTVTATMTVTNTGEVAGDEVAQLYLHDPVASLSQPVRRLVGFKRVTLAPGKSTQVRFTLDRNTFGFHDNDGRLVVEPGTIELYGGSSSKADKKVTFTITR